MSEEQRPLYRIPFLNFPLRTFQRFFLRRCAHHETFAISTLSSANADDIRNALVMEFIILLFHKPQDLGDSKSDARNWTSLTNRFFSKKLYNVTLNPRRILAVWYYPVTFVGFVVCIREDRRDELVREVILAHRVLRKASFLPGTGETGTW